MAVLRAAGTLGDVTPSALRLRRGDAVVQERATGPGGRQVHQVARILALQVQPVRLAQAEADESGDGPRRFVREQPGDEADVRGIRVRSVHRHARDHRLSEHRSRGEDHHRVIISCGTPLHAAPRRPRPSASASRRGSRWRPRGRGWTGTHRRCRSPRAACSLRSLDTPRVPASGRWSPRRMSRRGVISRRRRRGRSRWLPSRSNRADGARRGRRAPPCAASRPP
jgi:hypothetical protein